MPTPTKETVHVVAGRYEVKFRYGNKPEGYTYFRGDPFQVTQEGSTISQTTITLHKSAEWKVPHESNHGAAEFDKP